MCRSKRPVCRCGSHPCVSGIIISSSIIVTIIITIIIIIISAQMENSVGWNGG